MSAIITEIIASVPSASHRISTSVPLIRLSRSLMGPELWNSMKNM